MAREEGGGDVLSGDVVCGGGVGGLEYCLRGGRLREKGKEREGRKTYTPSQSRTIRRKHQYEQASKERYRRTLNVALIHAPSASALPPTVSAQKSSLIPASLLHTEGRSGHVQVSLISCQLPAASSVAEQVTLPSQGVLFEEKRCEKSAPCQHSSRKYGGNVLGTLDEVVESGRC